MKYTAHITDTAENNLKNICDYTVNVLRNTKAKDDLIQAIDEKLTKICKMPTGYRICEYPPLAAHEIRFATVKKYKLYFSIEECTKTIHILFIKHQLQNDREVAEDDE